MAVDMDATGLHCLFSVECSSERILKINQYLLWIYKRVLWCMMSIFSYTHAHHFNDHFPGKPGLVGYPLDSQSPVILIVSILTGQAKTLHTHRVLRAVPCTFTLTAIQRGFEAEVFTDQMPFLSPNQQRHSTEGIFFLTEYVKIHGIHPSE